MKSIVSIAALVAVAGSAAAQLDMAQPIQTGEPQFVATDGVAKVWNKAYVPASTKAGLDGNGYAVGHAVADIFTAQGMGLNNDATFISAGQVSPFPLNFVFDSTGERPIFYDPAAAAWAGTAAVPLTVVDDPTLFMLVMDSDVETVPGTHEIVIRSWFASDGASVFPFAQPSVAGSPTYTPTIATVNDALPEADRHPVGLGGDIGDAVNGLSAGGLEPPAGMVWDQAGANVVTDWVLLGFRQLDGAFVGVTFGTFPTISFDGAGDLVVDFQALQPATLNFNPDTGTEDFSVGGGPIAWGDGLTDSYNAYALQFEMTVTAMAGGTPCPGDLADEFGIAPGDGMVAFGDFLFLLGVAGPCPGGVPGCPGDLADEFGIAPGDGMVAFGDFLFLLGAAGPCP